VIGLERGGGGGRRGRLGGPAPAAGGEQDDGQREQDGLEHGKAGGSAGALPPGDDDYGVVVDRVNVSDLLYVPVRSTSPAPIPWRKPRVTMSAFVGPV
jgi:hypothetical protein